MCRESEPFAEIWTDEMTDATLAWSETPGLRREWLQAAGKAVPGELVPHFRQPSALALSDLPAASWRLEAP